MAAAQRVQRALRSSCAQCEPQSDDDAQEAAAARGEVDVAVAIAKHSGAGCRRGDVLARSAVLADIATDAEDAAVRARAKAFLDLVGTIEMGDVAQALREACEQDVLALELLAARFWNGDGVAMDKAQAFEWFKRAAACGSAQALCQLGDCYADGDQVCQSKEKALVLWREAASKGSALAAKELDTAPERFEQQEKQHNSELKGQPRTIYSSTIFLREEKQRQWQREQQRLEQLWKESKFRRLQEAARMGNPEALFRAGVCFAEGCGVAQDSRMAVELWQQAAAQGNSDALFQLGLWLFKGKRVARDRRQAIELWKQAASLGNARAMYNLGVSLSKGAGVAKDKARAVEMWKRAASLGNADAMAALGKCFFKGEGVIKDRAQAVEWWRRAALLGNERAADALRRSVEVSAVPAK